MLADAERPRNIDAERAVLGAVLADGTLWTKLADLAVDDFDHGDHRRVFDAMRAAAAAGLRVDYITVGEHLKGEPANGTWNGVLADLMSVPAVASNLAHHAAIVTEKGLRRRGAAVLQRGAAAMVAEESDAAGTLNGVRAELGRLAAGGWSSLMSSSDLVYGGVQRIQAAVEHRRDTGEPLIPGMRSGIKALDTLLGGFERAHVHIIAGQTSMGKSSFALACGLKFAEEMGEPGLVLSNEDHATTMSQRLLSSTSSLPNWALRFGALDIGGLESLSRGAQRAARLPIQWDFEARTLSSILRSLRQGAENHGARWAVIDYIQNVTDPAGDHENRNRELGRISAALAEAAKELDMALLVLSQLKRIEGRRESRPGLSDLRDSGSLEQDAYTVTFVHRPGKDFAKGSKEAQENPPDRTQLIVAKNKNGPLDTVVVKFVPEFLSFSEWL